MPGVHMGGANYTFMDGHGATFPIQPNIDYWFATGGGSTLDDGGCATGAVGETLYTYPPELHTAGQVAGADWWVVGYYPDAPIFVRPPN